MTIYDIPPHQAQDLMAVLTTLASMVLLPFIHMTLIRVFRKVSGLTLMGVGTLMCFGIWFVVFSNLADTRPGSREWVVCLSLGTAFALAHMQVFSLASRGFSLSLLIDVFHGKAGTVDDLCDSYAGGKGLDWMLRKRLEGLVSFGLVEEGDGKLSIRSFQGRLAARLSLAIKGLLGMKETG